MSRQLTGLFGGKKQTQGPLLAARINSSIQGVPVAIILGGLGRVAGSIIDYFDFAAIAAPQSSSSGGKGGVTSAGSKGTSGQYNYTVSFIVGHCEGPVQSIEGYWINGSGPIPTFEMPASFEPLEGTYQQGVMGFTEPFRDPTNVTYRGICLTGFPSYPLGNSAQLPQINADILSLNNGFMAGQPDGDPTIAFTDFLTNPYYGVTGFPAARLAPLAGYAGSWQSYCLANGFAVTPILASAVQASSFLMDLTTATNAAPCWQNGQLTVIPYGDTNIAQGAITEIVETHTVPSAQSDVENGVATILVGNRSTFVESIEVQYSGGGSRFGQTGFPPTIAGTYAILAQNGAYYFAPADFGAKVDITYTFAVVASFIPDIQPIYDFTIDDFLPNQGSIGSGLAQGNSPISITRKSQNALLNDIKVEYLDRGNNYNPVNIEFKDNAAIVDYGQVRPSDVKQYHFFCLASAATQSAALQLVRAQIARTFQFTVGKHFTIILNLMKIATLTQPQMGLFRQPVRVIEIQENQDQTLTITAEEFPGTAAAPEYGTEASAGYGQNYNQNPGGINAPIIFEPTDELGRALISTGGLMIAVAVSGVNPTLWGGCTVWASYDGLNYTKQGVITGGARMGVLTAPLPSVTINNTGATIDATNTLSVDLGESDGALESVAQIDALGLNSRCYVGSPLNVPLPTDWNPIDFGPPDFSLAANIGEVIAYQNATLTGSSQYALTYLVRGAYGTESNISTWPAGTGFARLDQGVEAFFYDKSRIGQKIFLKFQSVNIWQGGQQALSDVPAYTYTITGLALSSPLPVIENLTTNFVAGRLNLTWDEIDDFRGAIRYEIRAGDTFAGALSLGTVAHPPYAVPGSGTYWVTGWCQPAAGLIVRSETPVSIEVSVPTIIVNEVSSYDCKANNWGGTFTSGAGVDGTINAVRAGGAGNVLAETNILGDQDVLNLGGIQNGTYTPAFLVDVGRVTTVTITISWVGTGIPVGNNVLNINDILGTPDILGSASAAFVDVSPSLLISQAGAGSILDDINIPGTTDILNFGIPFAPAQKYSPGDYVGRAFGFQFDLTTIDPQSIPYLLSAKISVQVPDRIDNILTNAVLGAAGQTFIFTPDGDTTPAAFNGGPNGATVPQIIASWGDEQPGDVLSVTGLTLSGCTVKIVNGGIGVQRIQVNLFARGY